MTLCYHCGKRVAVAACRRCGSSICNECYFHHGLCKSCAVSIGRMKLKRMKTLSIKPVEK